MAWWQKKQEVDSEYIGARLRQEREARQLSREDCAEAAGVAQQQIHKYEKGTNRISALTLAKLARLFKVHPGIFFD
jgi:transcriptional regulator with XRE-family HTH domain